MNELNAALVPIMKNVVSEMTDHVYKVLNHFLQEYYNSYNPKDYHRSYDFLRSAVKVKPQVVGNKVVAFVYIDVNSMNNYYEASGRQVVEWANQGLHGGTIEGNNTPRVWNDTIKYTVESGELLRLATAYLKSKGFTVKA